MVAQTHGLHICGSKVENFFMFAKKSGSVTIHKLHSYLGKYGQMFRCILVMSKNQDIEAGLCIGL